MYSYVLVSETASIRKEICAIIDGISVLKPSVRPHIDWTSAQTFTQIRMKIHKESLIHNNTTCDGTCDGLAELGAHRRTGTSASNTELSHAFLEWWNGCDAMYKYVMCHRRSYPSSFDRVRGRSHRKLSCCYSAPTSVFGWLALCWCMVYG